MAEIVLDGTLCESCSEYLGDAIGFPRRCRGCGGHEPRTRKPRKSPPQIPEQLQPFGFVKMRNPFHLQARIGGKVVNYWPTTRRWQVEPGSSNRGTLDALLLFLRQIAA